MVDLDSIFSGPYAATGRTSTRPQMKTSYQDAMTRRDFTKNFFGTPKRKGLMCIVERPKYRERKRGRAETRDEERSNYLNQQHASWVLNVLLHFHQERGCLTPVKETMVVGQGEIHHL